MGQCDGTLGQRRYFKAEPFSSIFTSAENIDPYNEEVGCHANYLQDLLLKCFSIWL